MFVTDKICFKVLNKDTFSKRKMQFFDEYYSLIILGVIKFASENEVRILN